MKTPGIEVRPIYSIDGHHHLNEVYFTDVRVPLENLVGQEGMGWTIAKFLLTHERTTIAGVADSHHEISRLKNAVEESPGFLDKSQARLRIAELEIELMALEYTNFRTVAATDEGRPLGPESSANVLFDDVDITDGMILACGEKAEQALSRLLAYLRVLDCARMYGAAGALYRRTLEYAKTRKQFGVAIGSFQIIQHYLVDMFIDLRQLESMLFMEAVKAESEDVSQRERASTAAKAYYADKAVRIAQQAIQIHGGIGVTEELDIGHYFRLITHCSLTHGDRAHHIKSFSRLDEVHQGE
jgi:alkylation response protein AidB-like acyl-CoA dehydrogenase